LIPQKHKYKQNHSRWREAPKRLGAKLKSRKHKQNIPEGMKPPED
jgi:hypothetical protein